MQADCEVYLTISKLLNFGHISIMLLHVTGGCTTFAIEDIGGK